MKVAIDVDNTICKTSEYIGKEAEKYDKEVLHKKNKISYEYGLPRSEEWTKEEFKGFIKDVFNKKAENIPIIKDAQTYIKKLKEDGFQIVFITKRGFHKEDHTDLITAKYLDTHNIPHDEIIAQTDKKYEYLDDCQFWIGYYSVK